MNDIVILGSSGFATEVLWLLEDNNQYKKEWNILGFIDNFSDSSEVLGYPVLGNDEWLLNYEHPVNAVCAFGNPALRCKVAGKFLNKAKHITFPNLISRAAVVSKHTRMGQGNIICANSVISPTAYLHDFVISNLSCTIGHDVVISDFTTLNPGSSVSGNVTIGERCEIGTGTHVIQGVNIGPRTITGAGSAIIRDTPGDCTVVGVPGRVLEK